ncbi:MAG: hypothetical protein ACE5IH_03890 [Thermodesulfobacteriota bacterium]
MRRTELLQEVRKMRFEEVYGIWTEREITQEDANRYIKEVYLKPADYDCTGKLKEVKRAAYI